MNLKMIWMVPPWVWQSSVVAGLLKCPQSLPLREKSSSILTLQCPHSPGHTGIPVLLSSPLLSSTDFGLIFRTVSSSPKFCLGSFFLTWRSYSFQPLELVTCTYAEDGQFLCSSGVPMSSLGLPGWFFHFWFFFFIWLLLSPVISALISSDSVNVLFSTALFKRITQWYTQILYNEVTIAAVLWMDEAQVEQWSNTRKTWNM